MTSQLQADSVHGEINGHIIGHVLKEAVRRAMRAIQRERFVFEATAKVTAYNPDKADVVTNADKAAQEIYVTILRESFPQFGIVAEENDLSVECTVPGHELRFTVDPLDGTKAFVRQQSHGVGSMVSLMKDGEIIAAYVGDVMTGEIYGYRPGSTKVHRLTEAGLSSCLEINPARTLREQRLLLRDEPGLYSPLVQQLVSRPKRLDGGYEIGGGSIGIHFARLWKGEVGMTILRPGVNPPWDLMPVLGTSQKLGFEFRVLTPGLEQAPLRITHEVQHVEQEIVVFHESRHEELRQGLALMG